uniref:Protein kinase domain-containing protein n=1 Tax=Macrostomum lignano TaxID=282301 RepID=A0A1I8IH20_9PLAT
MFAYLVKAFSFDPFDTTEVFQAARTMRMDRSLAGQPDDTGPCFCFSDLIVEVNRTVYDEFGIGNPAGPRSVRLAARRAEEIVKVRRPTTTELTSSPTNSDLHRDTVGGHRLSGAAGSGWPPENLRAAPGRRFA